MAGAPVGTLNQLLTNYGTLGRYISLHTADPGTTGANEVTGGSPAYARLQTTWGTASGGVIAGSAQTINVPPSTTIGWFGVWSTATGGTYITGGALRNAGNTANITEVYNQQGTYAITPRLTADNA